MVTKVLTSVSFSRPSDRINFNGISVEDHYGFNITGYSYIFGVNSGRYVNSADMLYLTSNKLGNIISNYDYQSLNSRLKSGL